MRQVGGIRIRERRRFDGRAAGPVRRSAASAEQFGASDAGCRGDADRASPEMLEFLSDGFRFESRGRLLPEAAETVDLYCRQEISANGRKTMDRAAEGRRSLRNQGHYHKRLGDAEGKIDEVKYRRVLRGLLRVSKAAAEPSHERDGASGA